jgi:hypothetical protein
VPKSTPTEIITSKSWDKVLFTSYVISLSFYETQLHRFGLARNNCRDIRIVCDKDGYQFSLGERQTRGIGNEYQVTPALLPQGIFHPKMTWLSSEEIDIVLIGSGNLTFGGFGKNVECMDIIRSDTNPESFAAISSMLEAWRAREDLRFAKSDWIGQWASIARKHINNASGKTPAILPVHSTLEPIGEQLALLAEEHGGAKAIRVLSPFYEKNAWGILEFARLLNCMHLTIGLLSEREENSSFPFNTLNENEIAISAAIVEAKEASNPDEVKSHRKDARSLHAKIFEIDLEDGKTLLMTGSVNATYKSLLTSDNIEVANVRLLDEGTSPFSWSVTSLPRSHTPCTFEKSGHKVNVIVSASINLQDTLIGEVILNEVAEGTWQATLQKSDGENESFPLEVSTSGRFKHRLSNPDKFRYSTSLQLLLKKTEVIQGRGWVDVEFQLAANRKNFLSPSLIEKLLRPIADEDDEMELLRYLSTEGFRHIEVFGKSLGKKKSAHAKTESEKKTANGTLVPIELLATTTNSQEQRLDSNDLRVNNELDQILLKIRQALFERKSTIVNEAGGSTDLSADEDKVVEEEEKTRQRKKATYLSFCENIQRFVRDAKAGLERSAALCMWIEIARTGCEPTESQNLLKTWILEVSKNQKLSNSYEPLAMHYLSGILVLSFLQNEEDGENSEMNTRRMVSHERLEKFCDKENITDVCKRLEIFDSEFPEYTSIPFLETCDSVKLKAELDQILAVPTVKQQLAILNKDSSVENLPILNTEAGKKAQLIARRGIPAKVRPIQNGSSYCPHCHLKMPKHKVSEIEKARIGLCMHSMCRELIIASL